MARDEGSSAGLYGGSGSTPIPDLPCPTLTHVITLTPAANAGSARTPVGVRCVKRMSLFAAKLASVHGARTASAQHIETNRHERHMSDVAATSVRAIRPRRAGHRIMTKMVNSHLIRDKTKHHLPSNTVSFSAFAIHPELSITIIETALLPKPIGISTTDLDTGPEPNFCTQRGAQLRKSSKSLVLPVMALAHASLSSFIFTPHFVTPWALNIHAVHYRINERVQ